MDMALTLVKDPERFQRTKVLLILSRFFLGKEKGWKKTARVLHNPAHRPTGR
jgi:hypothetical protein